MPETLLFNQVNAPIRMELIATADGEVLAFKNAILARAETNANDDDIDAVGIGELASTIVGRPVDVEHNVHNNCGVFTAARPVDGSTALSIDGVLWADRYPEQARGLMSGTHGLSVEASAERAICSVCNSSFAGADDYCVHLQAKKAFGAKRQLRGLKGKGGAVTTHPAGTDTKADPSQVYFVASHQQKSVEVLESTEEPTMKYETSTEVQAATPDESAATTSSSTGTVAVVVVAPPAPVLEAASNPQPGEDAGNREDEAEVEGAQSAEACNSGVKGEMEAMQSAMASLKSSLESLTEQVSQITASLTGMKMAARRQMVRMSDEEWAAQEKTIVSMDDAAFALLASTTQKKQPLSLGAFTVRVPEPDAGRTKEPLTLR